MPLYGESRAADSTPNEAEKPNEAGKSNEAENPKEAEVFQRFGAIRRFIAIRRFSALGVSAFQPLVPHTVPHTVNLRTTGRGGQAWRFVFVTFETVENYYGFSELRFRNSDSSSKRIDSRAVREFENEFQ